MNKGDLVETVAAELKTSKQDAARAIEAVLTGIAMGVKTDEKVSIVGFGTFQKKLRPARTMSDPRTRQPLQVAASTTCTFKPASALKESL
ncbi:MAG: HU family DNA-binding protein [Phycisphaerales bacterium]